jgi:tetraacyldisaccharide 4'-kinase
MFAPSTLHALASGERRGFVAGCFRAAAAAAEVPVRWYVVRKNQAYDSGRRQAIHVQSPVVSVGNLTVGGTGKTPLVEWIARWFAQQQQRVTLISRGYRSSGKPANDEALELAWKLPEVPHLQNPDRVAAAREAIERFPGSVLLLDDAFQHRRIRRDLDIVLLDALVPFGYERLIPRGLLREPVEGLRRAQVVVLSRANLVEASSREAIRDRIAQIAPQAAWAEAIHAPQAIVSHSRQQEPLDSLAGKRVAAFCGIGNPAGFRRTLEALGVRLVAWHEFPDHCPYNAAHLSTIEQIVREHRPDVIVCTLKDLVKIPRESLADRPLRALTVSLQISAGEERLRAALSGVLALRETNAPA